jgi:gliding motility associated protien GldN
MTGMKKLGLFLTFFAVLLIAEKLSAQNVLDGLYIPEHTPERKVVPYSPLRNADVMYQKRIWRIIDLREKLNHPLYYPTVPTNGRKAMYDHIKDALVVDGNLVAFNEIYDDFKVQLTRAEVMQVIEKPVEKTQEDPDNPGTYYQVFDTVRIEARFLNSYLVKEDWFFDKQRSVMDVRILGIAPIVNQYDEEGAFKGKIKLFWLYYPFCRDLFAKAETFNRFNDAERRTLEDIIWKRMFSSYMFKESNVFDRQLDEYLAGMDILLEGEKIKEDMFSFEQDMWHY